MSKSALMHAPPSRVWGLAPPENFVDSRSSETSSSAKAVSVRAHLCMLHLAGSGGMPPQKIL